MTFRGTNIWCYLAIFVTLCVTKNDFMKGFVTSTTRTITDENGITRERTESKQFVYRTDEDSFYAVFISYVKWLYRINSAVTIKVLLYMLDIAEFNTGRVSLTAGERSNIMEELHISSQALSRAVRELVSVEAISKNYIINRETGEQRERKGEYLINPEMFWKGELKKRRQLVVEFRSVYDDEQQIDWSVQGENFDANDE